MTQTSTTATGRRARPIRTLVATTANTLTTSLPKLGESIILTLDSMNIAIDIIKLNLETTRLEELAEALADLKSYKTDFNLTDAEFKALVAKSSLAYLIVDTTTTEVQNDSSN